MRKEELINTVANDYGLSVEQANEIVERAMLHDTVRKFQAEDISLEELLQKAMRWIRPEGGSPLQQQTPQPYHPSQAEAYQAQLAERALRQPLPQPTWATQPPTLPPPPGWGPNMTTEQFEEAVRQLRLAEEAEQALRQPLPRPIWATQPHVYTPEEEVALAEAYASQEAAYQARLAEQALRQPQERSPGIPWPLAMPIMGGLAVPALTIGAPAMAAYAHIQPQVEEYISRVTGTHILYGPGASGWGTYKRGAPGGSYYTPMG